MNTDILWAIGSIVLGAIILAFNSKKDPNYVDRYGYRGRSIFGAIACIIVGIYVLCKLLFF
ncbi:MAG: hypothetical protein NVSMB24_11040 [Mucilaginibacter sp.]